VSTYADDLRLGLVLADMVDSLTLARFGAMDLQVETKPDLTPVSDADRAAEELIRNQLRRSRSRDAITGEEFGTTGSSSRHWVVDPIDGTKNFVRGVPVWATLIALIEDDVPVVGVVSAPALGRRWWASSGTGAWTGRNLASAKRLQVSKVGRVADASVAYSSYHSWEAKSLGTQFDTLLRTAWRTRGYGDFWSYMLLAEGAVDIAAEPELALYDVAALIPVVTEAGGTFTGLQGGPAHREGSAVATNGILHEQTMRLLTPEPTA